MSLTTVKNSSLLVLSTLASRRLILNIFSLSEAALHRRDKLSRALCSPYLLRTFPGVTFLKRSPTSEPRTPEQTRQTAPQPISAPAFIPVVREWRTEEVEISQDSNGRGGSSTERSLGPFPGCVHQLHPAADAGWEQGVRLVLENGVTRAHPVPRQRLEAQTTHPAADQSAQPRKPSGTQQGARVVDDSRSSEEAVWVERWGENRKSGRGKGKKLR